MSEPGAAPRPVAADQPVAAAEGGAAVEAGEAGRSDAGRSGLFEEARALGALRWLELRCFEIVGAWAGDPGPPEIRVVLATLSAHHAWRADLVRSRLPIVAETAADVVTTPSRRGRALADALRVVPGDAVGRLAVAARVVLPGLATAYDDLATSAGAARHDAMGRVLRIARDDTRADWWAAARTLERHLSDPATVARAGEAVVGVETAMATT